MSVGKRNSPGGGWGRMANPIGSLVDSPGKRLPCGNWPDVMNFPWKPEARILLVIDVLKISKY